MFSDLQRRTRELRMRGFIGPHYSGWRGRLRILWQKYVRRVDIILIATPEVLAQPQPPGPELELRFFDSFNELRDFIPEIEAQYYPGFTQSWREPFDWGECLVLALLGGKVAGFRWVQAGKADGFPIFYGRLWPGDYRILRGGVLPQFRNQRVNTRFHRQLLAALFGLGAQRVYADCTRENVFSMKALLPAGYRPVAEVVVTRKLLGGEHIQWRNYTPTS